MRRSRQFLSGVRSLRFTVWGFRVLGMRSWVSRFRQWETATTIIAITLTVVIKITAR